MKRGEIYTATLDPAVGSEISKTRPVLIVSNDLNNQFSPLITIVPITSTNKNKYPFHAFIDKTNTGLLNDSVAMCEQVRTIGVERFGKLVGQINSQQQIKVDNALKLHLDLL